MMNPPDPHALPPGRDLRLAALLFLAATIGIYLILPTADSRVPAASLLGFYALAGGMLYAPALLAERLRLTEGIWLILLAVPTALVGIYGALLPRAALLLALGATTGYGIYRELSRSPRPGLWQVLLAAAAMGLVWGLLLSNNHAHVFHAEAFSEGILASDNFYHAAVAESLASRGVASASLHGSPPLRYHYLSHLAYGAWSHLVGLRAYYWYAICSPLLLIVLYFRYGFAFATRLAAFMQLRQPGLLLFAAFLLTCFTLPFPVARYGRPLLGESTTLSLLLVMIHAGWLLRPGGHRTDRSGEFWLLGLGSLVLAILISYTKISTGFVWAAALGVLALLRLPRGKFLLTLPLFAALAAFVYLVIFPVHRLQLSVSIAERVRNVFVLPGGAFYLLLPALTIVCLSSMRGHWWGVKNLLTQNSPRATVAKAFAVAWLAGTFGALVASHVAADVIYFTVPAYVVALYLLFLLLTDHFHIRFTAWMRSGALLIGVLALVLATPHYFYGLGNLTWLGKDRPRTEVQDRRLQLYRTLREIDGLGLEKAALYVPPPADYFYSYLGSTFPFTALTGVGMTGMPVVSGFLPEQLAAPGGEYGLTYYKRQDLPLAANVSEALALLPRLGLERLVVIHTEREGLRVEVLSAQ